MQAVGELVLADAGMQKRLSEARAQLDEPMTIDRIRRWVPIVSRYSFHTGELADSIQGRQVSPRRP
jgi:hypothetical protein